MMTVEEACDPEFIIWKNIGYTEKQRLQRKIISLLSVFLIVFATYIGILYFKNYRLAEYLEILPVLGEKGLKGLNCE